MSVGIRAQTICAGASILFALSIGERGGVMNGVRSDRHSRKYLIVDDHAGFRQTVRDFLPGNPIEVFECRDGAEALIAYHREKPDWVLLDIEMAGMDGLSALREIRSQDPQARVAIVTQHDNAALRREAASAGAIAFISKDDLIQLRNLLEGFQAS